MVWIFSGIAHCQNLLRAKAPDFQRKKIVIAIALSRPLLKTQLERFSLDCRKGLVLVLVLLRPLVG